MELLTTRNFNNIQLDCYKADNVEDDFLATREQIGQLLGYVNPEIAIGLIHKRNADRLDKFSTLIKMNKVEGSRTVTRDVIVYTFEGLLEICRWSRQKKANDVIDFLWSVAKDIRKHGMYISNVLIEQAIEKPIVFEQAALGYINSKLPASDKNSLMVLGYAVHLNQTSFLIKEAANILRQFGLDIGEYKLWRMLREDGYVCRHKGIRQNVPTQKGIDEKIPYPHGKVRSVHRGR